LAKASSASFAYSDRTAPSPIFCLFSTTPLNVIGHASCRAFFR
jgi:hypothetical protein